MLAPLVMQVVRFSHLREPRSFFVPLDYDAPRKGTSEPKGKKENCTRGLEVGKVSAVRSLVFEMAHW